MILSPTIQRHNKKKIYGFDIETYDRNKKFYCGSVYGDDLKQSFLSKRTFIDLLRSGFFNGSILCATNLGFDFFGVFFGDAEVKHFNFIFRGSDLLYAKTYITKKAFQRYPAKSHKIKPVTFLDTLNYAHLSVEKLGKILNISKLKKPVALGKKPKTKRDHDELMVYNMRDSEISCKALQFFYPAFEELGATPKLTLASTSMSLFKNKYLETNYYRHNEDVLLEIFKSYYGGRTEAFCRGNFKNYQYYDFNSLYPAEMCKEYPDPNTLRSTKLNTLEHIKNYDGVSLVDVTVPKCRYPLLPMRTKDKLLFPYGKLNSWYTHVELRQAIRLGYKITKVYKTHYYLKNCRPFKRFVNDMYRLRKSFKGTPMEYVIKILMNSLYGKFGQKFKDKDNLIPLNHTLEELEKFKQFEIVGNDYVRIVEDRIPASFCIPIWATYVTAYGRLKLHKYIELSKPLYCDTDSLITRAKFTDSPVLGELKLEATIKTGTIVKPKFYAFTTDSSQTIKVKGVGTKLVIQDFMRLLASGKIKYTKFAKIKESLRRGLIPNEIIDVTKKLSLEDDKRVWTRAYDGRLQQSLPRDFNSGENLSPVHV